MTLPMQKKRLQTHFTGEWEILPAINPWDTPRARCGHTLSIHGGSHFENSKTNRVDVSSDADPYAKLLVTFGESSLLANRDYLNDMHLFDLKTSKWVKILGKNIKKEWKPYIKTNFNPIARADHASCAFGKNNDRCLLFGGKCHDTYLDDLIIVKNICNFPINQINDNDNTNNNTNNNNSKIDADNPDNDNLFNPLQHYTSTPIRIDAIHLPKTPTSRRGASLCSWKEGAFLLFGGQRGALFFNDLWGLDLYKQGWVELTTRRNPMPRAFHSAFVDSQQQMLILGGVRDTQANPAPADIYKLDLRAGKFFRLGDKDIVPGLLSALGKGHHSSHFLTQTSDLIIYSPQSADCHVLGGNVKSEHCGKCTNIQQINNNLIPTGTCRPGTTLLPSYKTTKELRSFGCNSQTLDRIFVFGGYSAQSKTCDDKIYSMKFSSTPCPKQDHKCLFSDTPLLVNFKELVKPKNHVNINNNNNNNNDTKHISDDNNNNNNGTTTTMRLQNVTPMRKQTTKSRFNINNKTIQSLNNGIQSTPLHSVRNHKVHQMNSNKRVSIVETPVRFKADQIPPTQSFLCYKNDAAGAKIATSGGLNPSLISHHQRYRLSDDNDNIIVDNMDDNNNNNNNSDNELLMKDISCSLINHPFVDPKKSTLHWRFIEKFLLAFDESLLDPNESFLFEPSDIISLIYEALPLLESEPTLLNITAPCKIFGDIHGQLGDLMSLFKSFGYPDTNVGDIGYYKYVFLGDFVDRGQKSLEVMCLLLALKIEYPDRVFLVRGNHECHAMNELYGFYHEINERLYPNINTLKYLDNGILNDNIDQKEFECLNQYQNQNQNHLNDNDRFEINIEFDEIDNSANNSTINKKYKPRKLFSDRNDCINYLLQSFELLFRWLPLGLLIDNRILCVHGGIGRIRNISEIANIKRPCDVVCDVQMEMNDIEKKIVDLLWSDPAECDQDIGFQENKRGVSCVFGSDIVKQFCKNNDIDLIIRGHQVVKDGYEYFASGHLITLFSATNYCNVMDNAGALLCIDDKLRVLPKLVEARPPKNDSFSYNSNNNGNMNNNNKNLLFDDSDADADADDENNDPNQQQQWKEFKQFPPSPMRNSDNNSNNQQKPNNSLQIFGDDEDDNNGLFQPIEFQ